jgi:2,4-dienoyl-CoA reductase (NADPH2)
MINTKVIEITDKSVKVEGKKEMELPADTVVLAIGTKPENKLAEELISAGFDVKVIGDAGKAGTVMEAVEQGFEAGRTL